MMQIMWWTIEYCWMHLKNSNEGEFIGKRAFLSRRVHIRCRYTILEHLSFRDFFSPSLFSYSPCLSLSLFLFLSLSLSFSFSLSLSLFLFLSLSLSLYNSLPLSLTYSVPSNKAFNRAIWKFSAPGGNSVLLRLLAL